MTAAICDGSCDAALTLAKIEKWLEEDMPDDEFVASVESLVWPPPVYTPVLSDSKEEE